MTVQDERLREAASQKNKRKERGEQKCQKKH